MSIKNLMLLGAGIAGVALLKDKSRRDKLIGQARNVIDNARQKLDTSRLGATSKANGTAEGAESSFRDYGSPYTPAGSRGTF